MKLGRTAAAVIGVLALGVLGACVEDAGVPPGTTTASGVDVNRAGLVAVSARDGDAPRQVWTLAADGTWTELPSPDPDAVDTVPAAVNDAGTVVGWTRPDWEPSTSQAVMWMADGTPTPIPRLPGGTWNEAVDIDEDGRVLVAGGDATSGSYALPYLWDPATGAVTELAAPIPGQHARPVALADDGTVAGNSFSERGDTSAWVWRPPDYVPHALPDPSESTRYSEVTGIDDDGTVVGHVTDWDEPGRTGVRWSHGGEPTVLGDFLPVGIDAGTMLGHPDGDGFPTRALLWPAGAGAPESLGAPEDGAIQPSAIAGDRMAGSIVFSYADQRVARLTRHP